MYAATLSTPARRQRSPIATRIPSVAIRWLRRFSLTHQPASTSLGAIPQCHRPRNAAQRHRGSCCPLGPGLPMGRIRALATAVQRRGCHATHHPSSPTLVRARLRRAGKEASGSAVPLGEPSLAPPNLLRSVLSRLSIIARTLKGHSRTLAQASVLVR